MVKPTASEMITQPPKEKAKSKLPLIVPLIILLILLGAGILTIIKNKPGEELKFQKFASKEEFIAYLEAAPTEMFGRAAFEQIEGFGEMKSSDIAPMPMGAGMPERISKTNVQVKGIDEPDIVKTNGQEIYFSPEMSFFPGRRRGVLPLIGRIDEENETKIIKAFPPASLASQSEIDQTGNLLLAGKTLIIFDEAEDQISGYDVADPALPTEKWQLELNNNNSLVSARLYQDKIYFVTQQQLNHFEPCPLNPIKIGSQSITFQCTDVYYPQTPVPVDVTFFAFKLNPQTGQVEEKLSFVGSSADSILYMSSQSLYITYTFYENMMDYFYNFFVKEGKDLVPQTLTQKLKKLQEYDISSQAKMMEFQNMLEQYFSSLDEDEQLRIENEYTNRLKDYSQEHLRELEKSGLVKIDLKNFSILATGTIPGRPLNQFALDEYQNHLRIATTVGETSFNMFGNTETANDVYVLDKNLNLTGSVIDLGLGERIYSARFIEDKGYLVTFRQIDPFFVLDLSNPRRPEVKGELKIPGYSSYLHPLAKNKILGIGKEGSQVKLSLFDVASPANPTEISKYTLDEYWSEILETHHAFLLDSKHRIFFLPGSRGGYIFSYQNNQLELKKAVADIDAKRALYINDYLYLIGENKIVILNEADWEEVNQLEF